MERLESNATFTGLQKGLTIVGTHAYAYNRLALDNDVATWIEFDTGKYYLVGTIQMGRNMKSSAETDFLLYYNDIVVYSAKYDNGIGSTLVMPTQAPLPIIIAPYTHVKLECEVNDAADTIALSLTGRVYE